MTQFIAFRVSDEPRCPERGEQFIGIDGSISYATIDFQIDKYSILTPIPNPVVLDAEGVEKVRGLVYDAFTAVGFMGASGVDTDPIAARARAVEALLPPVAPVAPSPKGDAPKTIVDQLKGCGMFPTETELILAAAIDRIEARMEGG